MGKSFGFREASFLVNCFIAVLLALYIAFRLDLRIRGGRWSPSTLPASRCRAHCEHGGLSCPRHTARRYRHGGHRAQPGGCARTDGGRDRLWVGLCLYVSLLDRTPRAYVLQLSGFTAALVGFPTVLNPGGVFDVAIARMEEIMLGTMSAALVHSVIFPRSVLSALLANRRPSLPTRGAGSPTASRADRRQPSRGAAADRGRCDRTRDLGHEPPL